jgi:membrane-associated phospholipid phosphatase
VHHEDVTTESEVSDGPLLTTPSHRVAAAERYAAALAARTGARGRFLAAAAAAITLLALTWLMAVGTEVGQRAENAALLGAEFRASVERQAGLARLSLITATMFGVAVVGLFLVALSRRRAGLAIVVAGSMVASVVAAELLKALLPRPELVTGPTWLLRNSFPSGTAAVAGAVAVGGLLVAPDRLRWLALPLGAVYAAVIGEATQATGWHRLSDVVGSLLIVVAITSLGLAVLAAAGLVQPGRHGRVHRRISSALAVVALVALVVGALLLVLAMVFPLLTSPSGARRVFLQTAFPLIGAGVTIGAITAFARLVEPYALGVGRRPAA